MTVDQQKEIGSWNDYLKVKDRHDEILKLRELLEPKSNYDAPINELKQAQIKAEKEEKAKAAKEAKILSEKTAKTEKKKV